MELQNLAEIRTRLDKLKGKKEQLLSDQSKYQEVISKDKKHLKRLEKAKVIVDEVGLATQNKLKFHISDIASLALESVFHDPYKMQLEFETKRGKNECSILFERDGHIMKPEDSSGIGSVDIAAVALRTASWSMQKPRPNNIILMDEPFKHLSPSFHESASMMLKELSNKLKLQLIVITQDPVMATFADRHFKSKMTKKKIKGKKYNVTKIKRVT